jgi:hypothetical protein
MYTHTHQRPTLTTQHTYTFMIYTVYAYVYVHAHYRPTLTTKHAYVYVYIPYTHKYTYTYTHYRPTYTTPTTEAYRGIKHILFRENTCYLEINTFYSE